VHGAFAVGIGEIDIKKSIAATAIQIAEVAKKPPPPPPPPAQVEPEPPKPEARKVSSNRPAAPAPEAEPAPPAPNEAAAMDALPDFGLSLTGGVSGGGLALPAGPSQPTRPAPGPVVRKALAAAPPTSALGCAEPANKPKPRSVPQPAYTADARTAGVEGKVRIQLTVDESGRVVDVRVLQGLGHGLDEAALAAARQAQFEPATQCGKPVRATFNISMRFTL
jgi:protein TonB